MALDPLADELPFQGPRYNDIMGVSSGCSTQVQVVCPVMNHDSNQGGGHRPQHPSPGPGVQVTITVEQQLLI